ncbi:hypothetical protein [Candidatus Cardinium sp. cByotN1]|uniref:hypothetical protein n=1 Tax=Candidatus Cardinium sp. cByotN1 TaxID=2699439 RepID=UPI001FB40E9A|nr:hypothetical protein [Candidatus Cardinium sp. cByotN1]
MALRLSISRYSFVFLIFFLSLSGCPSRNNSNRPVSAACTTSQKTEKKKKTKKKEKNDQSPRVKISNEQNHEKSMLCRCQNNIISVDKHLLNERYHSDNAIPPPDSNDQVSITNQPSKPAEQHNQNPEVVKDQLYAVHSSSLDLKQKQENHNKKSEKGFISKFNKPFKKWKKWKIWSTLKNPFSSKEKVSKKK